jgi:uncharacterized membrane protein
MQSKAKLLGHPIHQMLIPVPLGLFIVAALLDVAHVLTGAAWIPSVSFFNLIVGIGGGLLAAVFGAIDWWSIPQGTRAKRIGLFHGAGNVLVVSLFAVAVAVRYANPGYVATMLPLILEIAALALGGVTAWLGGELVDRLGVGVDDGAHLDAPSSLGSRPASGR